MAETDRNTGTASDGAPGAADADINKLKSQIDELSRNLEDSRKEVKTLIADRDGLKAEVRELKATTRKKSDDEAVSDKDIEKLRKSLEGQIAEALAERDDALKARDEKEALLQSNLLKGEIVRQLNGHVNDPETVYTLLKDHFELKDDGKGNLTPRVKDSIADIKTFVDKTLTESKREYFLLSGRKGGTGQKQPEQGGSSGAGISIEQLATMSPADQRKAFAENPKLTEQFLGQAKLG